MMTTPRCDFRLYLITDRHAMPPDRPLVASIRAASEAGARAVQVREKDLSPRAQYALAQEARKVLRPHTRLLINERADLAVAAGLGGVHLTAAGLTPAAARVCLPEEALIGVSTHSLQEARFAAQSGADFLTFGPVYPTPSKAAYGEPVGLEALEAMCAAVEIPVFALGGITLARVPECLRAGAHGVAVIRAVFAAPRIADAARAFADALGGW